MTEQSRPHPIDPHPIDDAVELTDVGADPATGAALVRGRTVEAWSNMVGPFGGATAAVLLQAVLRHPERHGDPLSLTVNFAGPVADGAFEIAVRPARTNRSNQHWVLEMLQDGEVVTTATAVTGLRRETWSDTEATIPDVPAPEDVPSAPEMPGFNWIANYDMRFVTGGIPGHGDAPAGAQDSSVSTMWVRGVRDRPLDAVALTALCDSFYPRPFLRLGTYVPAGTVTLTIHFLATADEIAAQGTDFLLGSVHAHRLHGSYCDASTRLWGRDGALLATSHQLMYFKA